MVNSSKYYMKYSRKPTVFSMSTAILVWYSTVYSQMEKIIIWDSLTC